MITNVDINKIYPHPYNPRKNVGDVSELAASVLQNGIMQNLTVVPRMDASAATTPSEPEYTVVIGHRRLAAAQAVGLTTVPCAISEMDEKQQIATMLLENIQRVDLTPIEQAEGFQMMLDLGETMESIAEQTGFSKATIRHRIKLTELDREALEGSQSRGGSLQDYMKLEQIKDIGRRNKVLGAIGTSNFAYQLQQAIQEEQRVETLAQMADEVGKFATLVTDGGSLHFVQEFYSGNKNPIDAPTDADTRRYFYRVNSYGITLFSDTVTQSDVDPEVAKKKQAVEEKRKQLSDLCETMYNLRLAFVRSVKGAKKHLPAAVLLLAQQVCGRHYSSVRLERFAGIANLDMTADGETDGEIALNLSHVTPAPEKALLAIAYCTTCDSVYTGYFNYKNTHEENHHLDAIYSFLTAIGYEMSDAEKQMQDGTHPLFAEDAVATEDADDTKTKADGTKDAENAA